MHAEWQNVSTFSDLQACDNVVFRIGRRSSMRNGELYRTTESFHDVDGTPRRQGPSKSVLRRIGGFFSDIDHLRLDPVGQLPWLMDVDEARSTLTLVAKKVETRAAKRKVEAEAAAEAERLESERIGAACKAFRAR